MSRIGKVPIELPSGVEVKIAANVVTVKGPKGQLEQRMHRDVTVEQKENQVVVSVKDPEDKDQRALWGLSQRLIANMVHGVSEGFSKQLEINGVGYRAAVQGRTLVLTLGYSHPIDYQIPQGIDITVEKNLVTVTGIDKQVVGQTSAEIRKFRKPEPYKGKGIKYVDEVIIRKAGKAAAKGA